MLSTAMWRKLNEMMVVTGNLREETRHSQTFNQMPKLVVISMPEVPFNTSGNDKSITPKKKNKKQNTIWNVHRVRCLRCHFTRQTGKITHSIYTQTTKQNSREIERERVRESEIKKTIFDIKSVKFYVFH